MIELAREILSKYGIKAVGIVIVLVISIWLITHQVSAPGQKVSILFGLVEYTKDGFQSQSAKINIVEQKLPTETNNKVRVESANNEDIASTIRVEKPSWIAHVKNKLEADEAIESLRKEKHLRSILPLESGKDILEMPFGTYGSFSTFNISSLLSASFISHITEANRSERLFKFEIDPINNRETSGIEVQRSKNGAFSFVVFTSKADASRITGNNSDSVKAILSPGPWEDLTEIMDIPINCVDAAESRGIKVATIIDATLVKCRLPIYK